MCLTIIEILFLVAGVWLLFSGKIPSKYFSILFGKGDYVLSSGKTRLLGLLLLSPLPLVLFVSFTLALFLGDKATTPATIFEIVYDLVVIGIAIFVARKIRQPVPPAGPFQQNINPS